jgi:hypothetical protein
MLFRHPRPHTQKARVSVHPIHLITKATTLTLEVQGSQARALQENQGVCGKEETAAVMLKRPVLTLGLWDI